MSTIDLLSALRDLPGACDFCGNEVPQSKLEPLSGDQWACWDCLDRWDREERDAEVARIMAMTDEEIRQDCILSGTTVEVEAAKVKDAIRKAIERFNKEPSNEA